METRRDSRTTEDKIPQIPRLHIPRASLTSSSSSNASTSKSSSLCRKPNGNKNVLCSGESETEGIYRSPINQQPKLPIGNCKNSSARNERYLVHKAPKPSSLHSISSATSSSLSTNGSNQSNYSANSMLLSVKNLESFNNQISDIYNQSDFDHRKQMMENIKNILAINEENLTADSIKVANKKKDADQLSTTSSATNTNFTVITFNGNKERKKTRSICRRRHQVTILIVVMTVLLFFGISSAVCMLEMRYKKMPR